MKKNSEEYDELDESGELKITKEVIKTIIHIEFPAYISDRKEIIKIKNILRDSSSKDEIHFHLSGYGGDAQLMHELISALEVCDAPVLMRVEGNCYSATSILAVAGDSLYMHKNTYLMFHNYSGSAEGKGAELKLSVKHQDEWLLSVVKSVCMPFLTEDEVKQLEKDQDVYIKESDRRTKARIKRHFK